MAKKIIVAVLGILAALLGYVAMQPAEMSIFREQLVKATPEKIFPHINNSKMANDWMPWADVDPKVKMSFSGPDEGIGSASSWDSEGQMGTGQAVVVESVPNRSVKTQLTYTKPMSMSQMAEVSLSPSSEGTVVRWAVTGKNDFMGKFFGVVMNMDKMVGGQFEAGLSKLKTTVEKAP